MSQHTLADWRYMGYKVRPTRHRTDDGTALHYTNLDRGMWQFLIEADGFVAQTGPHYASQAELLADADRFAHGYGFPTGRPAEPAAPAGTTVYVYWLGLGSPNWPDPLTLPSEGRAAAWLAEHKGADGVRVVKVTETHEAWAPPTTQGADA